jgi:hypothetical protein
MNYSIKNLSNIFILFLIFTTNVFAQDSLNVSGVVLYPVAETEGNLITPGTPSPTPFDNIKVSQDVTNQVQFEVSIDINPTDPDNIVAAWIDYSYDNKAHVTYGYSFDGGQKWTEGFLPTDLGGYPRQGDPAVAADKDGNFFISFISFDTGPYKGGIYVAKSTDGGITFPESDIVRLDGEPYDEFDDKPYIAIDKSNNETMNNIYVAWSYGTDNENEIHFARSIDNGSTFERQRINVFSRWFQIGAMPSVDANGDVYVVWSGHELGIPYEPYLRNFYFTRSTDGGENFAEETMIIEGVGCHTSMGGINLLRRIYPFPIIATNPGLSGHIYLTWSNRVPGPPPPGSTLDSSDVLFMRSTDYGVTWSHPINIINNGLDPSPTLNDQFFPWIAVDPSGEKISIMYYNRSDFTENDSMHINISVSLDDGFTFTPPLRITDVPSYPSIPPFYTAFIGDYNGMVYSPTGLLYPIWADSRNGNWDIYTAPADVKTVSTNVIGNWQTLSIPVVLTNFTKTTVWPTSNTDAYSFCGSGYQLQTILENGIGYWIGFPSAQEIFYAGSFLEQFETPVCAGWNIVGSISEEVPISTNVCLFPGPNYFTSSFFIYQNGYQLVTTIKPGMGHWIKVAMDGGLLVNIDPIQCDSPESIEEESMDHFIVTDADGKKQDLYVANLELNPSLGEMDLSLPPPLPEIGFDARFSGDEYIKTVSPDSGEVELVIDVEAQAYPITLSWDLNPENGITYSFIGDSGVGKISEIKSQNGNISFNEIGKNKIRLFASGDKVITSTNFPPSYSLIQNYPNPFNPVTLIKYSLPKASDVKIAVYDILGREIVTLIDEQQQPGKYEVKWDASNVSSGIYFYQLKTRDYIATKKMILIK